MSFSETTPLQIPSNLVKTIKVNGKDTLNEKYSYDLIGTNGYIEIDPAVVKFTGYEAGKVNITKVRIINCSSKSQRVHILPPSTPYFSIKFDKKGQLAPGMSEDVFIHFTPNDYKYYFDCVRVHTADEQLQIPIHAYPVMSRDINQEIFPRVIDFGICAIGTTSTMRFPLSSKIPLNFEYEFITKKDAGEIKLIPSKGLVPGKGSVEIEVQFNPNSALTVVAEFELNISQFDFEPIKVKVMGSGKLKDSKSQTNTMNGTATSNLRKTKINKLDTIRMSAVDMPKGISEKASESLTTFLNMKENERPMKESTHPIPEEESGGYKTLIGTQKSRQTDEMISPTKKLAPIPESTRISAADGGMSTERQFFEKQFLERFNQIQMLDKEKNIKFFQCIGDPKISEEGESIIKGEREDHRNAFLNRYENDGVTRYEVQLDQGLPIVGEIVPKYHPTYDNLKNDNIRKRRRVLHKLMSYVSKKILKSRKKKRLDKIKKFLGGATTRAEVRQLVEEDWQRAEYFGVGKRDFVMFNFQYSSNSILDMRLPLQVENSAANLSYKFELNQRIGFDDFTPIDPLPYSDIEVMGYTILDPPMIINYPPIEANRKDRKGAEEEYSISGPTGPVEKVSDTLELMEPVPIVLKKPPNVESYKFVCPHPTLKTFVPYFDVTETDPEFALQPKKLQFQDSLDPTTDGDYDVLYREFLSSAPGMDSTRAVSTLPLEFTNYYTHRFNLVSDFGFEEHWEKMCPDLIDKPYDEDKFSDSDSDEHNSLVLDVPDVNQFLSNLEADEPKIKDVRNKFEKDIYDEQEATLQNVNTNLENEKKLWSVTLTTKLPVQEVDFLLHLAPKKIDDHYVLTNNSFEILCLLMRIDIKSKCAFPKVNAYLLELARGIFNLRAVNQSYYSKISSRVDFLEFDVINRVNLYLLELLNTFKHKGSLVASIKSIVMDSYVPKFMKLVSEMSNNEKSIEQSLDKNEILWLRSLLKLPMRNPLVNMFKTENIVSTVKSELQKMTKIQVSQQTHDGFYKTGVLLHMFPSLDADVNTLQFMSNYTNTLIKRYLKFEEVNQKLLNPFRLALEVCISFQESLEGYMLETQKTLSLGKLLRNFLTELNGIAEDFYVKFISDILKSIEIVFWRIPSIQEKVKVIDIMFNYYMKCKSFSENVHQMMGDGRHNGGVGVSVNINGEAATGKFQSPERKKEETLHRVRTISDLVLNSIFKILDQEDFDGALVDYNNSLVYNFIVHVFNSLSSVGATRSESVKLDQDGHEGQTVKDPRKYEVYGFKFLYHLVKRFQSTRINELIYNLISSRFSLKVSLNEMKHIVNSLDEKAAQKMLVKMKLQMSLNITDNKLFYKSMNELVTYYSEVIEDPRYKPQEAFVYSLFRKLINKTKDEEKVVILWNQLTAFMTRLAKEVVMQSRPESFMQYFAKNLEYLKEILTKNIVKKSSSLPRDPKFIEKLIEIWIHIMLQKQNLLKTSGPIIEEIALLTPRLIQASGNSFTNTFLISPFLNNQKIIDKYRRNMKHVLREKMIELRPKIRNLTLGEMMFLLSIDYILDVKIREVARNHNRIVEVKKDIPLIEIIFCYVRDIYITEKENLKEVLEELLIRKTRSYLGQLQLLKQERQQMYFVERDFIAILQSSCSINKIYMKMSQMFLKEFIKEFPRLIFQEVIISSLAETLEFLYGKVLRQYDSVSARLKVSHYNLRIAVPDTLKDLNDLLVFMLAITHSMCLRGFIIEGSTLLKRVNDVLGSAVHKDLKNAIKVFKYLMWTLNNHINLTADTQTRGTAYWFYDRAYFLSKVERFENKHLEEGLKVISVIPAYSYEIHFDSKATINCLNQTLKEFKYYSETQSELKLLKEKGPTFQKIFHELKDSLIHFYTYSLIQRDKNYKQNLNEILKDPVLLKIFDKEAKDIISSTTAKPQSIFEKIKLKMDETYANVIANLQLTTSYIKMHPEQAYDILRKVYTLTLALPVRKILKFVIKKLTKNVLSSIPSKYSLEVLRALFFLFQEVIHKYNSYTNIEAVTKKKLYSFDLLEVNSDLFSKIRFKDLFSAGHTYVEICEHVNKIFYTFKERESLQIREVRSLFSIRHFIEVFNSVHKDIMMFMYNHLSIFLANYVEPLELMTFLQENFDINRTSIEHLNCENIFATVAVHLSVLNLLKTSLQLSPINKRFLQKFYFSTLKLAITYFAKNNKYYVDDTFESENCIQKIEKKMDLALKACRYLKIETFMETSNTVEKVDIPLKFPHVFLDMNVETPSKTKLLFKFSDHRTQFYFTKLKSRALGSLGFSRKMKNITAIYDPSTEKKLLLPSVTTLSRFQNLRKILLVLIGHEVDSIKAFNKTELGAIKYEFSFEDRALNETEAKQLLYFATEINMHLPIYMIRRLAFAIPVSLTNNPNWIRDLVSKYYLFNFPYPITFDYFVEKNLANIPVLRSIFYWETPQFALLMKYMTLEYQGHKNLQIYFAKTIKRLESTQLLFYLPQIYQTLNTEASYVVAQTLKEYSQSSYLFSHQLIWKTKVECKKEKNEKNEATTSRLTFISNQLLSQLLKGFSRTEKFLFNQVDGFFESVTAISGILNPRTEKKKKEETIRRELEKIFVNEYLYVPSNPQYMIAKIKLDSGRAMQSAAKCPILVSFYCKRFEGPDKYYPKLLNKDKIEADAAAESEDDPFIESEDHPSIHDLKVSSRVKLLPRDRENLTHSDDSHPIPLPAFQPLERIPEKEHEGSPSDVRVKILSKIEEQQKKEVEDPELFPKSMLEEVGTKTKKEEPTPFDFEKQNNNSFEDKDGQNLSGEHNRLEYSVGTSNILPPVGEIPRGELIIDKRYKSSKFTLHQNNFDGKNQEEPVSPGHEVKKNEEKVEEEKYEVISCIFKVFDDIRQDELALQVINLFKHIFQSVGLDLFLYPYRTISNRTGKDLDIGGIIEVVPNTISRDQMGKMMDCSLYEYFIARFGSEKSPEFQLARENFIKSMAAYSIVSYILQIKDRHNGNILIDAYGHIVHIDFGFIFDISPAHNMKFESANFKLTKEMIQIMGGDQATEPFNYFVDQTIKAFLAVRRFDEQLFNMIKLMSYSGLKCFRPMSLQNLRDRFMPRMNELQSATMMKKIILDAYNKLTTNLYDDIQHLQNKIHR